jgi:hypothetical protein
VLILKVDNVVYFYQITTVDSEGLAAAMGPGGVYIIFSLWLASGPMVAESFWAAGSSCDSGHESAGAMESEESGAEGPGWAKDGAS